MYGGPEIFSQVSFLPPGAVVQARMLQLMQSYQTMIVTNQFLLAENPKVGQLERGSSYKYLDSDTLIPTSINTSDM